MDQMLIEAILQVGVIPGLLIYNNVFMKKSIDNNTRMIEKLCLKLGVDNE